MVHFSALDVELSAKLVGESEERVSSDANLGHSIETLDSILEATEERVSQNSDLIGVHEGRLGAQDLLLHGHDERLAVVENQVGGHAADLANLLSKVAANEAAIRDSQVDFAVSNSGSLGIVDCWYIYTITFDTKMSDSHSAMDPSTGTFSAPVTGLYAFHFTSNFDYFHAKEMWVLLNGEIKIAIPTTMVSEFNLHLKSGDRIQVQARCGFTNQAQLAGALMYKIWF